MGAKPTYLLLLLLHLKLLLELSGAFQTGCYIHLLRRVQLVKIDVAETKMLADQLLGGDTLRSNKNETSHAINSRY